MVRLSTNGEWVWCHTLRANPPYPQATLHHTKEEWNEAMEMQAISPHLRLMLGEGFIVVTTEGKV